MALQQEKILNKKNNKIIIVGAGFAGISLIKKLRNSSYDILLIDKNNYHQFQPLLYQVATSGIEPDSIGFPVRKLFRKNSDFKFRMTEVYEINPSANILKTSSGDISYDYLVIATGSATNYFGLSDIEKNGFGMKSINEALNIRSAILENLEKASYVTDYLEKDALTNFVIVGGGPAGVETAGAIAEFRRYILKKDYPEIDPSLMTIYLIEASDRLLSSMSENASLKSKKYLDQLGVKILLQTAVKAYDGQLVEISNRENFIANTLIWTAGVKGETPAGLSASSILKNGRIEVDEYLKVNGYENIFAIGDIASVHTENLPKGHPMVAQVAIQQGKFLAMKFLDSNYNEKFIYKDKGSMATVGKHRAVADLKRKKYSGYFAWMLWSFIHLISISGFRNKLIVGFNWFWSYLSYEKGNRLIIRKVTRSYKK